MTRPLRTGLLATTLLLTSPLLAGDLVLTNGRIYTLNPDQPWADTVVIAEGRIATVLDKAPPPTEGGATVIDLAGKMVLPAFQDTHAHLAFGGMAYTECPVFDLDSLDEVLAGIKACAEAEPDAPIIRGGGWTMDLVPEGLPPGKELLDAIDDSRPIVFEDADGHALWINSKAMEQYGISAITADPPGGMIARKPGSREPSGTLHEGTAMQMVHRQWEPYLEAEYRLGIIYGRDYYHSLGITAFQEALIKLGSRDAYASLPAMHAMAESGELKMRASLALSWDSGGGEAQLKAFEQARDQYDGEHLRLNMVKLWADGVVETRTAMMLEPYSDAPDTHGLMMIPRQELLEIVPQLDAAGFQLHVHAIGDATVRYALDAFEAAKAANNGLHNRHHINHVQFVHTDDLGRFADIGVAASFEPLWAYEDEYITELTRPRVGPERIKTSYPINSILKTGARVAFSSDWSVSSADPLLGMEVAITRLDPWTGEGEPFLPDEAITLEQAIAAYTRDAAWLNGFDDVSGTIEPGKFADLVILDRNLFDIPVSEISEAEVVATLFEGEVVYGGLE